MGEYSSNHHHPVVVVAVPFPAQSHLNQLLQLSALISAHAAVPVHYACSATHLRQAKHRYNHQPGIAKIHFRELPAPEFASPPPDPTVRFPAHLQPSFDATLQLRQPMAAFLGEISLKAGRVIVIHDVLMSYVVQDSAEIAPNVERYIFGPTGLFASYYDGWEFEGKSRPLHEEEPEDLPSLQKCYTEDVLKFIAIQLNSMKIPSGYIYNTCRSIEGKYIDFVRTREEYEDKPFWAIGPLNLATGVDENGKISSSQHGCLDWLDRQAPKSVIYVSFGSITPLKDEQIVELAKGLEESRQKFIWVLRDVDRGDISVSDTGSGSGSDSDGKPKPKSTGELLEGYEERVKGNGLIVKDWAPQEDILKHPSTGGFMSHCGWNSCLESISHGVPIAAWPMHSDQPKNAFFVTNVLKMGVWVKKWVMEDEIVTSTTISEAVKRLMASEEGGEMRKKAAGLSDATRKAVKEGGVSRRELDSFIAHITRS